MQTRCTIQKCGYIIHKTIHASSTIYYRCLGRLLFEQNKQRMASEEGQCQCCLERRKKIVFIFIHHVIAHIFLSSSFVFIIFLYRLTSTLDGCFQFSHSSFWSSCKCTKKQISLSRSFFQHSVEFFGHCQYALWFLQDQQSLVKVIIINLNYLHKIIYFNLNK